MRVIAHRGASGHAPENTMAAFELALEMGASAIELDIHQTRDQRLVVIHDPDLRRTAGTSRLVKDLTLPELARLDVGRWFSPRFAGQRAPLLDDVLDLVLGRAELHVEVKAGSEFYPGIEERLLKLLRSRKALREVRVSSFDHPALAKLRSLDPDLRLGYLWGEESSEPFSQALKEAAALSAASMDVSRRRLRPDLVRQIKAKGLEVLSYTVNDLAEMRRLGEMGVDGVFSNYPELGAKSAVGGTDP